MYLFYFSQRGRRNLGGGNSNRRFDGRHPLAPLPLHRCPGLQPKAKALEFADLEITVSGSN